MEPTGQPDRPVLLVQPEQRVRQVLMERTELMELLARQVQQALRVLMVQQDRRDRPVLQGQTEQMALMARQGRQVQPALRVRTEPMVPMVQPDRLVRQARLAQMV